METFSNLDFEKNHMFDELHKGDTVEDQQFLPDSGPTFVETLMSTIFYLLWIVGIYYILYRAYLGMAFHE